ncbi:MAG: hypothetical protein AAFX06_14535 [Planctomycetota bacterium]
MRASTTALLLCWVFVGNEGRADVVTYAFEGEVASNDTIYADSLIRTGMPVVGHFSILQSVADSNPSEQVGLFENAIVDSVVSFGQFEFKQSPSSNSVTINNHDHADDVTFELQLITYYVDGIHPITGAPADPEAEITGDIYESTLTLSLTSSNVIDSDLLSELQDLQVWSEGGGQINSELTSSLMGELQQTQGHPPLVLTMENTRFRSTR